MSEAAATAREAADSRPMEGLARFGLAARAFVYLILGWLAFRTAFGDRSHQTNQRGVMAEISGQTPGLVLLWIVALGLAAYAVWRLSEAAFGTPTDGQKVGPRLQAAARGVAYAAFCVSTFSFIAGASRTSQSKQQATWTARLMKHDLGRWLVGLIGVAIVIFGVVLVVNGAGKKFEKRLHTEQMSTVTHKVVRRVGMVGTIARGVAFGLAGALVVTAAVTYDAKKSTGLDGAARTLANAPSGPWLLSLLAIGLIAFGIFGLAQARWAKV